MYCTCLDNTLIDKLSKVLYMTNIKIIGSMLICEVWSSKTEVRVASFSILTSEKFFWVLLRKLLENDFDINNARIS